MKAGRKTRYTEDKVVIICRAIAEGESYKLACSRAGISEATFARWREKYEDFEEAIKRAEAEYDEWYSNELVRDCKKSLKQLVCGYEFEETTVEYETDKKGTPTIKKQKTTIKKVAPNPTAIIFALTNREPERWKNRQANEFSGAIKTEAAIKPDLSSIPDDLLEQVLQTIDGAGNEQ